MSERALWRGSSEKAARVGCSVQDEEQAERTSWPSALGSVLFCDAEPVTELAS